MPNPQQTRLQIPNYQPSTDAEHAANMREIERVVNKLPTGQTLIARQTLTTDNTSVDFKSIPQDFQMLRLVAVARGTAAVLTENIKVTFNNDTAAHYGMEQIVGINAAVSASNDYAQVGIVGNVPGGSAGANLFGVQDITVYNYSSAVQFKFAIEQSSELSGTPASDVFVTRGSFWNQVTPVNRVTFSLLSGNFLKAGSVFSVYGIY